ncbi:flagellar basal-body rod protein FlgF [Hypericibacter adhaerens]|jgi:flagellar basal-body rod protein FlgF|uniref:Flagellar basal-body rod protein FlgF n=1 Tax=Hypericibacter adhaerens TaxID=2602016 RepID=A0A5J6N0K6_9PROT|nr:flagellar basal-body rod protein FlgF [Hypericibacter adhaerens]QEX23528.1 flagellar basal-body rod protein FlgF [Hypericibacter adhaerens]
MENAGYIALSRQMVLNREMDVIANNLANVTTPAFKGQTLRFQEFLDRAKDGTNLSYVEDSAAPRDWREGPLTATGNPLDVAIHGDGFFVVSTPTGDRYTRKGHFEMDASRQLVSSDGEVIQGESGPITVPQDAYDISIAEDGTVSAKSPGTPQTTELGKIRLVSFADPQALQEESAGLYKAAPSATATPVANPDLVQGTLEQSNVQPIIELTRMMTVSRNYEAAQQLVQSEHDRIRKAISGIVGGA